jgi:hypothetical protein
MAQPPFLVDVLRIEPGSAGVRTIDKAPTSTALRFIDPTTTATLAQFMGLRNVTGVYVVGTAGYGAAYTSIQDAIDAVPPYATVAEPGLVLVGPGTYTENLTIEHDGVFLIGLGAATIQNDGASHTITVQAVPGPAPQNVTLQNLTVVNDQAGFACLSLDGGSTFASGTVTVVTAPLVLGDTLTVGGQVLTNVCAARTPGSDDFNGALGTQTSIAAEIVDALNDPLNSFAATITAYSVGPLVVIFANAAGVGGNAITLVVSTTPAGGMTVSGPNLVGGSAAGSLVGQGQILIDNCTLQATNAGGFGIVADTVNNVRMRGGTFRGSSATATSTAANVASLLISDVERVAAFGMSYDSSAGQPATLTSDYTFDGCGVMFPLTANLVDTTTLTVLNCSTLVDLIATGGQQILVQNTRIGSVDLSGTIPAFLSNAPFSTLVVSGGTPTLAASRLFDSLPFVASASETYTFVAEQPDTSYTVLVESPNTASVLAVTNKTTTTFDIEASPVLTGTVNFTIVRDI